MGIVNILNGKETLDNHCIKYTRTWSSLTHIIPYKERILYERIRYVKTYILASFMQ